MFHLNMEYSLFVSVIALFVSVIAIGLAVAIFTVQQYQGKQLREIVKDIQTFTEGEQDIRKVKRKNRSRGIFVALNFIDFEIEGYRESLKKLPNESGPQKDLLENNISNHYKRIQEMFHQLDIAFDDVLEIFNHQVEEQYRQTWRSIMTGVDIFKMSIGDIKYLQDRLDDIETQFKKLRDILLEFLPDNDKEKYRKLFDEDRFSKR